MVVDPDQADEAVDETEGGQNADEDEPSGLRNRLSWWLRRLAPVKY